MTHRCEYSGECGRRLPGTTALDRGGREYNLTGPTVADLRGGGSSTKRDLPLRSLEKGAPDVTRRSWKGKGTKQDPLFQILGQESSTKRDLPFLILNANDGGT